MAAIDLHVHSKHSNHPSEWFLQRIGASESYTEPEDVYRIAKKQGMKFVTITDHNTIQGALELKAKYPEECFVSVESTVYFPEDGCKIHVLVYGIDSGEFEQIQKVRENIYLFRDFIRDRKLAYSVAHATYSVNDRLTVEHIEKLILLFDIFETMNGSRSRLDNHPLETVLKSLTPEVIAELSGKHGIAPMSENSWIKGFTGGSDDHSGLLIGKAFTQAPGNTVAAFLENLRNRQSLPGGTYSNFRTLAFALYKIAYEFSKTKNPALSRTVAHRFAEILFSSQRPSRFSWFKFRSAFALKHRGGGAASAENLYLDLMACDTGANTAEEKLDRFYERLSLLSDEFFRKLLTSLEQNVSSGNLFGLLQNVSTTLPGIFLSIPFLSTRKHFSDSRELVTALKKRFSHNGASGREQVLWFTDTLTDLNGVSMVLKNIGWLSSIKDKEIYIVTSVPEGEGHDLPPNVINLNYFHETKLPRYEEIALRFPSMLAGLKQLDSFDPDAIFISTPGPVGLFGLLLSRIMNVRSVGVFHTDFTLQTRDIFQDATVENIVESYLKWFYSMTREIQVPTVEYMRILDERGYPRSRMSVFRRGIDTELFSPRNGAAILRDRYGIADGFTLLYAGRISREKNIGFLIDVYGQLKNEHPDLNLLIAGDGPDLEDLRSRFAGDARIVFAGAVERDLLPYLYSAADLFVFPSTVDTFGMVVVEAQSCGLPVIVSDRGGSQELVEKGRTGYAVPVNDTGEWKIAIAHMIALKREDRFSYQNMRLRARTHILETATWDTILDDLAAAG